MNAPPPGCPGCGAALDLSPIGPSLFEAASRGEYQCQACKRWWRRENAPHVVSLMLEFKQPLGLTAAAAFLSFKIFGSLTALDESPPFEVWAPLLLGPLAVVVGIGFLIRGVRKRWSRRKLVSIERGQA